MHHITPLVLYGVLAHLNRFKQQFVKGGILSFWYLQRAKGMAIRMKIAICDDENLILFDLVKQISNIYTEKHVEYEICAMISPESLLVNSPTPFDVIFLDVDMGHWNGIDIAKHLRQYNSTVIIVYISGHIKYSPLGYKVKAFDYLLKNELDQTLEGCLQDIYAELQLRPETLIIKSGVDSVCLLLDDIVFIESQRAILVFHMRSDFNQVYKSYGTLQHMDAQLNNKGFLRIQKSFIVNLAHVKHIKNYRILLNNGLVLQTSRHDFQDLQRRFMLWKGR